METNEKNNNSSYEVQYTNLMKNFNSYTIKKEIIDPHSGRYIQLSSYGEKGMSVALSSSTQIYNK